MSENLDLVYELIEVAKATGKIKKGTNEATKAIEKGTAKFVAYAQDVNPKEVIMHIPLIAKEKGIPCVGVPKREELGSAAGLVVPTAAIAVINEGNGKKLLAELMSEEKPAKKEEAPAKEEKAEEKKEETKEAPAEEKADEAKKE